MPRAIPIPTPSGSRTNCRKTGSTRSRARSGGCATCATGRSSNLYRSGVVSGPRLWTRCATPGRCGNRRPSRRSTCAPARRAGDNQPSANRRRAVLQSQCGQAGSMNSYNRRPGATVVWVNEHSRLLLAAVDQKRIAELVAAIAALLGRSADTREPVVVGKGLHQFEMALTRLMDAGEDRVDDPKPRPAPDAAARDSFARAHAPAGACGGFERADHGRPDCDDATSFPLR